MAESEYDGGDEGPPAKKHKRECSYQPEWRSNGICSYKKRIVMASVSESKQELAERLCREKDQLEAEERRHLDEERRLKKKVEQLQGQLQTTIDGMKRKKLQDAISLTKARKDLAHSKSKKAVPLWWQRCYELENVMGGDWGEDAIQRNKVEAEKWEDKVKKNQEAINNIQKQREQYEESLRLLEEALSNGYFDVKIIFTIVVGPAGVGKTLLTFILINKKAPGQRSSTVCFEAPVQIQVRTVSAEQFLKLGSKLREVSADKMLPLIARYIRSVSIKKEEAIPEELKAYFEKLKKSVSQTTSPNEAGTPSVDGSSPSDVEFSVPSVADEASACSPPDVKYASIDETAVLKEMIDGVLEYLQKLIAGEELTDEEAEDLFSTEWIYLTSSSGFHELLPLSVHDVSSILVVSRLCDRLDKYPLDEFYQNDKLIGRCESVHLTAEGQIKCLIRSLLSRSSVDKLPKVIMVGTHHDRAEECSESVDENYVKDIFEAPHFLKLLKSRLAVVPLAKLDSSPQSLASAVEYFMPALLDILSQEELEKHRVFTSLAAPLLFHFTHGCRLAGVFCCLSVYLMKHCDWSIKRKDGGVILVARNCIIFRHPRHTCFITLIDAFYYIEAHVKAIPSICHKACPVIRDEILDGITCTSEKLNYIDTPQLAIFCPHPSSEASSPSTELRHAAVIVEKDNCCMCTKAIDIAVLEDKHTIWLQQPKQAAKLQGEAAIVPVTVKKFPESTSLALPTFKSLMFIEWRNEQGKMEMFRLNEWICHKWHEIGCLLEVPSPVLYCWEKDLRDQLDCTNKTLSHWMEHPTDRYPNTWEGLYRLLEHARLTQVAEDLKRALANAL